MLARGSLFLALLSFCNLAHALEPPVLRMSLEVEPTTLDWANPHRSVERFIASLLMRGLLKHAAGGALECDLCETMSVDESGHVLRFTLRPGVKWSDGRPLEASQFVDAWARLAQYKDATTTETLAEIEGSPGHAWGAQATGPLQLTIHLKKPSALFAPALAQTAFFPVRKELADPTGATLGPYTLAAWEHGKRIVLEGNSEYKGERPVYRVDFKIAKHGQLVDLFKQEKLDLLVAPTADDLAALGSHAQVQVSPYWGVRLVILNLRNPWLAHKEARRALLLALDRNAIPGWLKNGERPATGIVPPGLPGARTLPRATVDLVQGQALLVGLPPPPKLSLLVRKEMPVYRELGTGLAHAWSTAGVPVQAVEVSESDLLARLRSGQFDLAVETVRMSSSSALELLARWRSTGAENWGHFSSVPFDSRVEELLRNPESPNRAPWMEDALQSLEADEVGVIPLTYPVLPFALGHRVVSFGVTPFGDPDLARIQLKK